MKTRKQSKFKVGDEAILMKSYKHKSEDSNYSDFAGVEPMKPYVVYKSEFEHSIFNSDGKMYDTIYLESEEIIQRLGHPAVKFRKVERVKWTLIDASELNRGDIVKPSLSDNIKYIVLSKEKGMLKLLPAAPISNARPDGYIQKEDGTIRFYLVGSFYKLINISEL